MWELVTIERNDADDSFHVTLHRRCVTLTQAVEQIAIVQAIEKEQPCDR